MDHPNAKLHLQISLIKSVVRIAAGVALIAGGSGLVAWAGVGILAAETLGIAEELV
jgi:hypothetical protein